MPVDRPNGPLTHEWSFFEHTDEPEWDRQWWFCSGAQAALSALKSDYSTGQDRKPAEVMKLLDEMLQEAFALQHAVRRPTTPEQAKAAKNLVITRWPS